MGTHPIFESDFDCLTDGNEMDLDSLVAYTVDKRQRNAEAASPELRKEALLSNTVKRAHRLLSLTHDDKIQSFFVDESFGQDDFQENQQDSDEQIDVTNDNQKIACQFTNSINNQSDHTEMQSSHPESHHAAKRKRNEAELEPSSPQKKSRVEIE